MKMWGMLAAAMLASVATVTPAAAAVVNFTLTPASGTIGTGTGTVTTSGPIASTGQSTFTAVPLSFTIDGNTFSNSSGSVSFINGSLFNVTFSQAIGISPNRFSLSTAGNVYNYSYNNLLASAAGTITATVATGAVPEPATWAMMMLGFGMIGFGMRYGVRRSNAKFDLKIKRIAAGLDA